jgi:hypothetical protein
MIHHTDDPICPSCTQKLGLAHPVLQNWFKIYVKPNFPTAHISWSFRGQADQEAAFSAGKTKCHWPDSPHNKAPAQALDLFKQEKGIDSFPYTLFKSINDYNDKHSIEIRWGGDFTSLGDSDHYQLP